jgi:hypothetical protein
MSQISSKNHLIAWREEVFHAERAAIMRRDLLKNVLWLLWGMVLLFPRPSQAFGRAARSAWPSPEWIAVQDQGPGDAQRHCRRSQWGEVSYPWREVPAGVGRSLELLRGSESPFFDPGCAPDTLYSWRRTDWTEALRNEQQERLRSGSSWPRQPSPRFVGRYFWKTPMGTFGYGDSVLRIKLKPHVKFQGISRTERQCERFSDEVVKSTVFVPLHVPSDNGVYLSEYLLCSEGPVDSWSINAPETLEEGLRELAWVIRKPESQWDAYIPGANRRFFPNTAPWFSIASENESWGGSPDSRLALFSFVGDRARGEWSYTALVDKILRLGALSSMTEGLSGGGYSAVYSMDTPSPDPARHWASKDLNYFRTPQLSNGDWSLLRRNPPPREWQSGSHQPRRWEE